MITVYIVGSTVINNTKVYKLLAKGKKDNLVCYNTTSRAESQIVKEIREGKYTIKNATVQDGKLKGTTGDLARFENGVNIPYVILNELRRDDGKTLGYRVANSDGKVLKISCRDLILECKEIKAKGGIPIQNGMYVDKDGVVPHIRSYPGGDYPYEILSKKVKNPDSAPAKIDGQKANKAIAKLDEMFTPEQIEELRQAKAAGVNIKIIGDNTLSPEQMHIIWTTKYKGLPAELFADHRYKLDVMKFFKVQLECRQDIRQLLNTDYSVMQIAQIALGIEQGVDITKFSSPKLDHDKMEYIRRTLYDKLWGKESVAIGSAFDNMIK